MPHAAIYWCNDQIKLRKIFENFEFQCRTRQFSGAITVCV